MKKIIAIILGLTTIALAISTYVSITRGGTSILLEVTADQNSNAEAKSNEDVLNNCCQILLQRCAYIGVADAKVYPTEQADQPNRIRVELKGVNNITRMEKLLTSSTDLGFWEMYTASEVQPYIQSANTQLATLLADPNKDKEAIEKENPLLYLFQNNTDNSIQSAIIGFANVRDTATINKYLNLSEIKEIFPEDLRFIWGAFSSDFGNKGETFELYAIKITEKDGKAPVKGDVITDAICENDYNDRPSVSIVMNHAGTQRWAQMTKQNIDRPIAIVLNNQLYSAPKVNCEIKGGRSQISGDFSKEQAEDIACMLQSGSLSASIKIVETNALPDEQWSIDKTLLICTLTCGLVFLFSLLIAVRAK